MFGQRNVARLAACGRWAILCCLAVAILAQPMVAAADPVQGTYLGGGMGRRVQFTHHDRDRNAWAGTMRFQLDSGEELLAFCIQLDVGVSSGARYKSGGAVVDLPNGCQIANLLDKYPGSSADSGDEAAARQLAVWSFSDEVDLATIPDREAALRDRASSIANEAKEGACPARRTVPPDLRITADGPPGVVGQRVAMTVSAESADAGRTVQARVTGPAVFDNGRQDTTVVLDMDGTGRLAVIGTGVGAMTVTVELPYRLDGGTVFAQLDDSAPSQRLVLAESRDLVATAAVEGSWLESPTATPVPDTATPAAPATGTPVQATGTVAAPSATATRPGTTATATGAGPTALASPQTAVARKTTVAGGTPAQPAGSPVIPARLPGTGRGGPDPWPIVPMPVAVGVGALVLAATGYWLRRHS